MNKSEFLSEISKMNREQIRKVLETNPNTKIKRDCPLIFIKDKKKKEKKKC